LLMERGRNLGCTKCEMNTSEYGVYGKIFVFINMMLLQYLSTL